MSKFKVKMLFSDGDEEMIMADGSYDDAVYDSEEEAESAALEYCSNYRDGAEVLHLSNPGDYEYDEDNWESPDYEIIDLEE